MKYSTLPDRKKAVLFSAIITAFLIAQSGFSQLPAGKTVSPYNSVQTYVNPVLPGDHPDPTVFKYGKDFYHCGSSFHFTPYMPVYHSTDMVHWKIISRVLQPAQAAFVTDRPSAGTWQGALTYFYGSFWIYFSANGQWFSKAQSPEGPWTVPVQVKGNPQTGPLGYDNSIFVDDDGKPYMVIKNGQKVNRLQALGTDGQLTDTVINLDWINAKLQYSWAEGPVMCKRNGIYYYFPAGDVSGGQYVLKATELTADSTKWTRLGNFFKPITDTSVGFKRPNHITAPMQLEDGSWWTLGQSYEKYTGDDWSGSGRQTSLYPVTWEGDRPWGMAPTSQPIPLPGLPASNIHWRSVTSDYFDKPELNPAWHFLTKKAAKMYALNSTIGKITLNTDSGQTHLLQKETDHYYSISTVVNTAATSPNVAAGLYITNGNATKTAKLSSTFDSGKIIRFEVDSIFASIPNTFGKNVHLKIERRMHMLSAFASADGKAWKAIGKPMSAANIDKTQPNYNSWVGTSVGLFAVGSPAEFDFFVSRSARSPLPAVGYSNYYGIKKTSADADAQVTTTTDNGGWIMISGVDFGTASPKKINLNGYAGTPAKIEIWVDDLTTGTRLGQATLSKSLDGKMSAASAPISPVTGQHDLFIQIPPSKAGSIRLRDIHFIDK